jgi:hypothetical protein
VNEHILTAVVADDETETLLRIEEFDDAFAFADDLRGHSATTATAAATKAAATAAAAESTAAATGAVTEATATATAEAAAITVAATISAAAAEAAAFLEPTLIAVILFEETVALVPTAAAAVAFAPFIETHARPNFRMPTNS